MKCRLRDVESMCFGACLRGVASVVYHSTSALRCAAGAAIYARQGASGVLEGMSVLQKSRLRECRSTISLQYISAQSCMSAF